MSVGANFIFETAILRVYAVLTELKVNKFLTFDVIPVVHNEERIKRHLFSRSAVIGSSTSPVFCPAAWRSPSCTSAVLHSFSLFPFHIAHRCTRRHMYIHRKMFLRVLSYVHSFDFILFRTYSGVCVLRTSSDSSS